MKKAKRTVKKAPQAVIVELRPDPLNGGQTVVRIERDRLIRSGRPPLSSDWDMRSAPQGWYERYEKARDEHSRLLSEVSSFPSIVLEWHPKITVRSR